MKKLLAVLLLFCAAAAWAEGTRTWQQSRFEEFQKGTAKGVAIESRGALVPAPAFPSISTTPSTYLWAVAADGDGNVYAAAGAPARVYRVGKDGRATVIFKPEELQVQALAMGAGGAIFAATSPDGKVYRITPAKDAKAAASKEESRGGEMPVDPAWTAAVYFEPRTKYIWDLALDKEGRLYVATGDRGEIFRVTAAGEGAPFFQSDEAHIRTLALDKSGNLIAGSDGNGLIYRISPAGEAFVLYSAPKKEITALAVDGDGNIYASGLGEKRAAPSVVSLPPATTFTATVTAPALQQPGAPPPPAIQPTVSAPPPATLTVAPTSASGGSEIYRIAADGSPRTIWSSREHLVYTLAQGADGRLLAGTGNQGRIFAIAADGSYADLVKASASQVTALAKAPGGGWYAATSNLGKIFRVATTGENEATFESDVFDARIFSRWGQLEARGTGAFAIHARSGNVDNPERNWSPWRKVDLERGGQVDAPPARFLQWKVALKAGATPARLESVTVNYRPKNVAPQVDDVAVQPGARFQAVPKPSTDSVPVNVGASSNTQPPQRFEAQVPAMRDKGSVAARWTARDENDDDLVFSLYFRGDGESRWKLLKDKISDKFYSWDASLLPDGGYTLKVVASDAPSNSAADALEDSRESTRFELDTTPPRIVGLSATRTAGGLRVTFRAEDSFSPVKRAEYSLDAGEWQLVEPVGGIADSVTESYEFTVPLPAGAAGEHVVAVRAYDRYDNLGAAKAVVP